MSGLYGQSYEGSPIVNYNSGVVIKAYFQVSVRASQFTVYWIVRRCLRNFLKWASPTSFSYFSNYNFNNESWNKRRWCAWDSNPGPQDGRHKQNHRAMAWFINPRMLIGFLSRKKTDGAAAIAPWFSLCLPSCGPRFESQAHHLCFFQFVLLKL